MSNKDSLSGVMNSRLQSKNDDDNDDDDDDDDVSFWLKFEIIFTFSKS